MTIIAENNESRILPGRFGDRQEQCLIPCPILVVLTLGSESCPGEGKRGEHQARIGLVKSDALVKKKLA